MANVTLTHPNRQFDPWYGHLIACGNQSDDYCYEILSNVSGYENINCLDFKKEDVGMEESFCSCSKLSFGRYCEHAYPEQIVLGVLMVAVMMMYLIGLIKCTKYILICRSARLRLLGHISVLHVFTSVWLTCASMIFQMHRKSLELFGRHALQKWDRTVILFGFQLVLVFNTTTAFTVTFIFKKLVQPIGGSDVSKTFDRTIVALVPFCSIVVVLLMITGFEDAGFAMAGVIALLFFMIYYNTARKITMVLKSMSTAQLASDSKTQVEIHNSLVRTKKLIRNVFLCVTSIAIIAIYTSFLPYRYMGVLNNGRMRVFISMFATDVLYRFAILVLQFFWIDYCGLMALKVSDRVNSSLTRKQTSKVLTGSSSVRVHRDSTNNSIKPSKPLD